VIAREIWQIEAACRGPQARVFFPPSYSERRDERARRELNAKAICAECHVRADCLRYAIEIREQHGIWGGMNEDERKILMERQAG
jgi:WhiB family redox-sensing transcriptional regulator